MQMSPTDIRLSVTRAASRLPTPIRRIVGSVTRRTSPEVVLDGWDESISDPIDSSSSPKSALSVPSRSNLDLPEYARAVCSCQHHLTLGAWMKLLASWQGGFLQLE